MIGCEDRLRNYLDCVWSGVTQLQLQTEAVRAVEMLFLLQMMCSKLSTKFENCKCDEVWTVVRVKHFTSCGSLVATSKLTVYCL